MQFGRQLIFTSERVFSDDNIKAIVDRAIGAHYNNAVDIERLLNYYLGNQDILGRTKKVRPDICNRIVINHAAEIANFKVGFTFGEPVQYVYRGKDTAAEQDNAVDDSGIAALNKLMYRLGKASKDRDLAQWLYICGIGYRLTVYEGNRLETYVCDPRQTFTIRADDYTKRVLLSCIRSVEKTIDDKSVCRLSVYSDNHYWEFEDDKLIVSKPIARNPITEYWANPTRQGCFEPVLDIIDALNKIESNRADGIEQFVQNLIWFNNCEITEEQYESLSEKGGICTKSAPNMPASIQMLSSELNQTESQTYIDDLYQTMLTIAAVPDRKASAGGNTGQALIIGEGWTMAESAAKSFELSFDESEKEFIASILKIVKTVPTECTTPADFATLDISDVDIKFTRNKTDNLLTKTQGLMNQLEAGIHPRIAIANCGLYSDPHQVYIDSESYLQKWAGQGDSAEQQQTDSNADNDFNALFNSIMGGETNAANE